MDKQPKPPVAEEQDSAIRIARDALQLISIFHSQATPDETPELNPTFPAAAFRHFVDEHATLLYRLKHLPAVERASDFAKIVRAMTGQQVLFFKGVDSDEGNVLHCVTNFDGYQADMKLGGIPDRLFDDVLANADTKMADQVLAQVAELGFSEQGGAA